MAGEYQNLSDQTPSLPTSTFSFAKDPHSLTSFFVVMLWISLGIEVVSMMGDFGQLLLLDGSFTEAEADSNDIRQALIGLCCIGVHLVTGVAFLKWMYRANYNCRGFGTSGMVFTPGWAIGYFFIPLLNLVRPYQAMREIWQVSQNPEDWKSQPVSTSIGRWWALWIISWILGRVVFRLSMKAESVDELQVVTGLSIFSSFIWIVLCLVVLKLVKAIACRQEALTTGELTVPAFD